MSRKAFLFAAPLLALALTGASPVWAVQPPQASSQAPADPGQGDSLGADWREQQNEARAKVRDGRHVPLERVIATIRRKTPGRLLDTGIEQGPDGRAVYRVRWAAASGRRIDFLVDAQSGAIISGGR